MVESVFNSIYSAKEHLRLLELLHASGLLCLIRTEHGNSGRGSASDAWRLSFVNVAFGI
jgi:hypothetical protein